MPADNSISVRWERRFVVAEFLRALRRPGTYDPRSNTYVLFGFLWGSIGAASLLMLPIELRRPCLQSLLLLTIPVGCAILFGALGSIRSDKAREVRRTIAVLEETVKARTKELRNGYLESVLALAQAIEAKDPYTGGHCWRVWGYAQRAAKGLDIAADEMDELRFACYLHDVGKIKIPGRILNKRGPLDELEKKIIALHPVYGQKIVSPVRRFSYVGELIRHHHERSDGSGYPDGLVGDAIPLLARILIVADAMDAMCSDRPYRKGCDPAQAIEELKRCAGMPFDPSRTPGGRTESCQHFDPAVVAALIASVDADPPKWVPQVSCPHEDKLIEDYLRCSEAAVRDKAAPSVRS